MPQSGQASRMESNLLTLLPSFGTPSTTIQDLPSSSILGTAAGARHGRVGTILPTCPSCRPAAIATATGERERGEERGRGGLSVHLRGSLGLRDANSIVISSTRMGSDIGASKSLEPSEIGAGDDLMVRCRSHCSHSGLSPQQTA